MRSSVKGFVKLAFILAGDLVDDVILIKKEATGFNFNTAEATLSVPTQKVVKALVESSSKKDLGSYEKRVIFDAADLVDPSIYYQAIIQGVTYYVITPDRSKEETSSDDGYLHTLFLSTRKA